MQYFSLSTQKGEHIGFLVMTFEDDSPSAQQGAFALKWLAGVDDEDLLDLMVNGRQLHWRIQGDSVYLLDEENRRLGRVQQQWLTLFGQTFVLQDLTGAV